MGKTIGGTRGGNKEAYVGLSAAETNRLSSVDEKIRAQPIEHIYIIDEKGVVLGRNTGTSNKVEVPVLPYETTFNTISVHNHPSGLDFPDGHSFSQADIGHFIDLGVKEGRVVSLGATYRLRLPEVYKFSEGLLGRLEGAGITLPKWYKDKYLSGGVLSVKRRPNDPVLTSFMKNAHGYFTTIASYNLFRLADSGRITDTQVENTYFHEAAKLFASEMGLIYTKTKK